MPGLDCPNQNTNASVAISTSVGFQSLGSSEYDRAISVLQPDIATGLVDIPSHENLSQRRKDKSVERTHVWLRNALEFREKDSSTQSPLMASIPNLESEEQSFYLADLMDSFLSNISGLCLHGTDSVTFVPKTLQHLPRLSLTNPKSPQAILRAVQLGIDLITVPFVTSASEGGIAFDFKFLCPPPGATNVSLGFDLWLASHASDLRPLVKDCTCYTCTHHHRAYIQHLLNAKEMLAWTLLQIHNFAVVEDFFQQVRQSIANNAFEDDTKAFNSSYSAEIPTATGQGPRVRGYQVKSIGGGEAKKNKKAYGRLDEHIQKLIIASPDAAATNFEKMRLESKQA